MSNYVSHKQSSDGGEGEAQCRDPRQTRGRVAQLRVAACLGYAIEGGVADAWEGHFFGLVALSLFQAALSVDIQKASCFPDTTEAVFSTLARGFGGYAHVHDTKFALVALQSLTDCKAESDCKKLEDNSVHLDTKKCSKLS